MTAPTYFDTDGWTPGNTGSWTNERGEQLVLQAYDTAPDLPADPLDEVGMRTRWPAAHGGNLGIECVQIDGLPAVSVLTKFLPQNSGVVILGSLIVPRADSALAIRVQCTEYGTTGSREAMVLMRLMQDGHQFPPDDQGRMQGWQIGPDLDPPLKQRNLADDEQWDAKLPDHCLSRCRRHLRHFAATTRLSEEFHAAAPFQTPGSNAED